MYDPILFDFSKEKPRDVVLTSFISLNSFHNLRTGELCLHVRGVDPSKLKHAQYRP